MIVEDHNATKFIQLTQYLPAPAGLGQCLRSQLVRLELSDILAINLLQSGHVPEAKGSETASKRLMKLSEQPPRPR